MIKHTDKANFFVFRFDCREGTGDMRIGQYVYDADDGRPPPQQIHLGIEQPPRNARHPTAVRRTAGILIVTLVRIPKGTQFLFTTQGTQNL